MVPLCVLFVLFLVEPIHADDMCGSQKQWQTGVAFIGPSYSNHTVGSVDVCCAKCDDDAMCLAWDFKQPSTNCFLYHVLPKSVEHHPLQRVTCGTRYTPAPTPAPSMFPPAPAKAMNVLMIAIDDMRPEMEPYGSTHMHTPNIQKLADKSMLFSRAYVQVAVCMPSRNALLFSRRADTTKAWHIRATEWPRDCGASCGGDVCGDKCGIREPGPNGKLGVTLPGWFYQHGFFTIGAGKIFHEGSNTQQQDYRYSWTPSTTNPASGLFEPSGGPKPMYNGKVANPSFYAFDVDDEEMTETMLAEYGVQTIQNLSKVVLDEAPPFFLAVGFHKPHVPWYAPKKYWDFYPNDTITVAPNPYKPEHGLNIAEQDVVRTWSTPKNNEQPLSCEYTDLCGEIYPDAPFANGRPGITKEYPYDNSSFPIWKAKQMRQAYWASLSYTDANIGRVLDALDASPFTKNTVIALWGDHGYALGDNALWAKQANFEHATHIPFMISVPGFAPGRSDALVEAIDLFPTLIAAATWMTPSGPTEVPPCPDTKTSRNTALCTEGRSLMPLIQNASASWGYASFSQFSRDTSCCDCPVGSNTSCCSCAVNHPSTDEIMGYTIRVNTYRYTGWFEFDSISATANFSNVLGTELYVHNESPIPVDFSVEHENVVADFNMQKVVSDLHMALVTCAPRPDLCPPSLLKGYVN